MSLKFNPFSNTFDFTSSGGSVTGTPYALAGFNSIGTLTDIPSLSIDANTGGIDQALVENPNGNVGNFDVNNVSINMEPLQDSPNESWVINRISSNLDAANSGFTQGTGGDALTLQVLNIFHQGTGDVGRLALTQNNFSLGNGTDPITVNGISYSYGFGGVNSNVTLDGAVQGYGFQPSINAAAILTNNAYIQAFYDNANIALATHGYTSFNASPNIDSLFPSSGYSGLQVNPTIGTIPSGAGMSGLSIGGNITQLDAGTYYQGININPNIASNESNVVGLNVTVGNVTNYAGVAASLVVQDITYTALATGTDGNNVTVAYTNTTTAGNEVAMLSGTDITVSIESGVSTATQVLAAINANVSIISNLNVVITGTASNPQVTYAQTNLAGGINAGTKKAASFDGDVEIFGALSFSGGLSIGALNSFASEDISGLPSGVNSIDTLITQPFVGNSVTLNADLLAINTAMLLSVGNNSTLTSSFLGYTALGLPAVVAMGTGSTIDRVTGATFAISLDSSGTGGTIAEVDLCRALAIPNGITAITKLIGYKMDLPFGDPGTTSWGFYESPGVHNYLAGDLKIGGADVVTNSSVGLEIESSTKAFLNARMTTTERDALTAINGMQLYNTTTDKLQVYAAGSWVDLH